MKIKGDNRRYLTNDGWRSVRFWGDATAPSSRDGHGVTRQMLVCLLASESVALV